MTGPGQAVLWLQDEVLAFREQILLRGCYMGSSDPPRTRDDPISAWSVRIGERPLGEQAGASRCLTGVGEQ
jgi:hypothetical protein